MQETERFNSTWYQVIKVLTPALSDTSSRKATPLSLLKLGTKHSMLEIRGTLFKPATALLRDLVWVVVGGVLSLGLM